MKFSFRNMAAAAPPSITTANEDTAYPATYSRVPQRRFLPSKTTTIGDTRWVWDLASESISTLKLVGLVRGNFATCQIQGGDDLATWPYTVSVTVKRNRWNRQYQHTHVAASAINRRYLSVFVPAQTPIVAPFNVFMLGGIHAGAITESPTGFQVNLAHRPIRSFEDVGPEAGDAWEERDVLGNTRVELTARRQARFTHATPYLDTDEAVAWLDIDAECETADHFYCYEDLGNPAMGFLVRQTFAPEPWEPDESFPGVVSTRWGMKEVVR